MFYQPELMIYLWMLPVLGMLILPVLWSITCMLYRFMERSRLADVSGFLDLNSSSVQEEFAQERRKHARVHIHGPKAKIAQQIKCCQSSVANVSPQGICLQNVPQKMFVEADGNIKVVFRTRERTFSMFVQPKWRRKEGKGYMIGAEIIRIPAGWKDFIQEICQPVVVEPA